jgi:nitrile hydratase
MSEHDHDHGADAHHPAPLSPPEVRARALEELLTTAGIVDPAFIDSVVTAYERDIGPMNGARVVARAWTDPAYRARLLADGTKAIAELGFGGPQGEHMVVVENTPTVHNVVVCTLCSCYPWPVLGLPPNWYKSPAYRARIVREPRALLAEMGLALPESVEIRVWDSSAEIRYLVLPERPAGTETLSEDELAALVTRDAMIGTARAAAPQASVTP